MGIPVMVMGESGSGKSTSMRNFEVNEVGIFNVASKPLPFRKQLVRLDGATYDKILRALSKPTKKTYVIDDSQYLLSFAYFDHANETGYNKFTDIAVNFRNLIKFIVEQTPADVIVYLLHHVEQSDSGRIKAKTIGKMLDEKLTVEGLFSIVLLAKAESGNYFFETQNGGNTTAKSPMEMFERTIDNDLKFVDTTIREYYNLNTEQTTNKNEGEN